MFKYLSEYYCQALNNYLSINLNYLCNNAVINAVMRVNTVYGPGHIVSQSKRRGVQVHYLRPFSLLANLKEETEDIISRCRQSTV